MVNLVPVLLLAGALLGVWMLSYVARPEPVAPPSAVLVLHGACGVLGLLAAVYLVRAGVLTLTPNANLALITGGGVVLGGVAVAQFHRQLGRARGMVLLLHGLFGSIVAVLLAVWALG